MTAIASATRSTRASAGEGFGGAEAEPYSAENALLDLLERNVETAIALGLGPQIRARMSRMLPEPLKPAPAFDGERWLKLVSIKRALRRLRHEEALIAWVTAEIEALGPRPPLTRTRATYAAGSRFDQGDST